VYVNASFQQLTIQAADGQVTRQSTHTLYAEGAPVAIHVRRVVDGAKTADQFRYLHRDPLDSIDTITDANMNVQERLSYGPFGQRRQANGQPLATQTRNPSVLTTKGYTGHEHLDQVTLINMNARLYDPITARFLSPDTIVPWPTHSQAHNRYIYVMNNPLKYNDPTGHNPANVSRNDAGANEVVKQLNSVITKQYNRNRNDYGNDNSVGRGAPEDKKPKLLNTVYKFQQAASFNLRMDIPGSLYWELVRQPTYREQLVGKLHRFGNELGYQGLRALEAMPGEAAGLQAYLATKAILKGALSGVTKGGTTAIGRVKDLKNLKPGEKSLLNRLPDKGNPKANWKQNSGVLRQAMGKGKPIRDASPGDTSGQFLNAERNLLDSRGWNFDKSTNFWNPPK
jgi:RHS repeat-associated protein